MTTTAKLPAACPECNAELQATVEIYLSREGNRWLIKDMNVEDARFYCANDHELPEPLRDQLRKSLATFSAFGRPPGSGGLDIALPGQ